MPSQDGFLDLESALEQLKLPAIPEETTGKIEFKEEDLEKASENAIKEVDSLEDFEASIKEKKENKEEKEEEEENPENLENHEENHEEQEEQEPDYTIVKGVSEWAKEQGLLEFSDDEFKDDPNWLKEKFDNTVESRAEEKLKKYKEELHPAIQELVNNYEEGVPLDELIYSKSREIEYSNISEEDIKAKVDIQKKLVSTWLDLQGLEATEIKEQVDQFEDSLILDKQALLAHKKLKNYEANYQRELQEQTKRNREIEKENYNKWLNEIKTTTLNSEEIIPGIKLSKEERQKIYESYTNIDPKTRQSALTKAIASDPKAMLKITQLMVLYGGNLEKVKTSLNSQVSKNIKETVGGTNKEKPVSTLGKINMKKVKEWSERVNKNK